MTLRLWAIAGVVALLAGLGAAAAAIAAPRGCAGQLGPLWGAILCPTEGLATAWSAMDLREPKDLATERARFDVNVSACLRDKDARRVEDRATAFACVRNRVWARTRALALRADPETITGRWLLSSPTATGELRVLALSPTAVRLELRTVSRRRGHVCTLALDDAWRREAEVAWKGRLEPTHPDAECDVSIRRLSETTVRLDSTSRCAWICGAAGDYRGQYELQP